MWSGTTAELDDYELVDDDDGPIEVLPAAGQEPPDQQDEPRRVRNALVDSAPRSEAKPALRAAASCLACGLVLAGCGVTSASGAAVARIGSARPALPARVRLVVLHTLGGPDYSRPDRRWSFLTPRETFALWRRPSFGAHWIVWTDGSIWPRRPAAGQPESFSPGSALPASGALAERLALDAEPVLSHIEGANSRSLGIEVAHSGRSSDRFPVEQMRSLSWLLRSLFALSAGRLGVGSVVGHKDLDRQPAWVFERCPESNCAAYADPEGRTYRRRVDPPEGLFAALERQRLIVPRGETEGDAELLRTEAIPAGSVPVTVPPSRGQ